MGYLPVLRSHLIGFCGEGICESYLLDNETDVKMVIPSSFDAGAIDLLISPLNNWMLVYSSYDGPDYIDYYSARSELILYKIEKDKGIQGLKPFKSFETGDWSMEEIVWIDDDSIALKIYEGQGKGDGIKRAYKYLKTIIE